MRKNIFGLTLLFVLFTACASLGYGQSGKAALWEISKGGNTVFLAGSVHMLRPQDYPMPAAFETAYKKSSMLVLEADVGRLADPDMIEYTSKKTMLPAGQTIRTVLNDEVYKRLETLFGTAVIGTFSQYKPSVIVNTVQTLVLQNSGFTESGADIYYYSKSLEDGKPIGFLEDVKVQIDMLSNMADGIENEYVSNAIDELPGTVIEVTAFISEWKEGAAAATEASISELKTEWPTVYEITLLNRNLAWMPVIENYLTTKPVEFIIVGMGHLYGSDGLLTLLRNRGYKIRQLVN